MKKSIRLLFMSAFCFFALAGGVPLAYAGCLDNASDAVIGLFSGGLSVAACEAKELVDSIKNFIKLVSDLAINVANNATDVANAAAGAVHGAIDDVAATLNSAQRDLGNAVNEADAMVAPQTMAMAPNATPVAAGARVAATMTGSPAASTRVRVGVQAGQTTTGAAQGLAKSGPDPRFAVGQSVLLQADPQSLHAALQRGAQQLNALKTSVEQGPAGRINTAIQRAGDQVTSHLSAVADIVQTALLAPINGLLDTLNDLVTHPTRLLDPIATINGLVQSISNNVVVTLNHINDVVTKDAIQTLQGVEADLQQVQGAADTGNKLLNAMRFAHQNKTEAALKQLETLLNASAPQHSAVHMMASGAYRFNTAHNKIKATMQKSVAPYLVVANKMKTDWGAIQARHQVIKARPLDAHAKQIAQTELDRMFSGKSPAEVESAKQKMMNLARQKYGSDPKLIASIEQNMNSYVRTHVGPVMQMPGSADKPPSPNSQQMSNPLPPKNGSLLNKQLPAIQK